MVLVGYEKLHNRCGLTWRLPGEMTQSNVTDAAINKSNAQGNSSVIKRLVIVWPSRQIAVGFDATAGLKLLETL